MSIETDDFARAPRQRMISAAPESSREEALERALRPKGLQEYVGQAKVREQLEIFIGAADRQDPSASATANGTCAATSRATIGPPPFAATACSAARPCSHTADAATRCSVSRSCAPDPATRPPRIPASTSPVPAVASRDVGASSRIGSGQGSWPES